MRQQVDCAVLMLEAHRQWMPEVIESMEVGLARIKIHRLEWEAGHNLEVDAHIQTHADADKVFPVSLPVETLAQTSIGLRRYDILVVPVSVETLGWTRKALASIPRGPFIPMIGILKDVRSAAIQDLLEIGLKDFVRLPLCYEEFRARLLHTVSTLPKPNTLREPSLDYHQAIAIARGVIPHGEIPNNDDFHSDWAEVARLKERRRSQTSQYPLNRTFKSRSRQKLKSRLERLERQDNETVADVEHEEDKRRVTFEGSLKEAKMQIIEDFEKSYITEALAIKNGNIASAALYAGKHRRAFWALMQKYGIDARDFKKGKG